MSTSNNETEITGGTIPVEEPQTVSETVEGQTAETKETEGTARKARKAHIRSILSCLATSVVLSLGILILTACTHMIAKYLRVEWRRQITGLTELVCYRNGDFQLRNIILDKRISKRYDTVFIANAFKDSMLILEKDGHYEIFSLKTNIVQGDRKYWNSPWKKVFRPDPRGVAAVVCENNEVHFVDVHHGAHRLPPAFPVQDRLPSLPEIRFREDGLCVIPHVDKGDCLIDTLGNILLEGFEEISLSWEDYVLATNTRSGNFSLYSASELRPLLTDVEDITITPAGICYYSGHRWHLTDSSATHPLTDLVVEAFEDFACYIGIETLYEPDEETPSPYKFFYVKGSMGVLDEHYNIIIEPEWDDIYYLGDGHFSCIFDCDKAVILDKHGEILHR